MSLLGQIERPIQPKSNQFTINLVPESITLGTRADQNTVILKEHKLKSLNNASELANAQRLKEQECITCKKEYYGKGIDVEIDFFSEASVKGLTDGKLYFLKISNKTSKGFQLLFDDFFIPEHSFLHIYTANKQFVYGAFTGDNNTPDFSFFTRIIPSNEIILEYFESSQDAGLSRLSIDKVIHIFRSTSSDETGFGISGSCTINSACSTEITEESKAVAMISTYLDGVHLTAWCTGSLINSDVEEPFKKPYMITAAHCLGDGDIFENSVNVVFYFNYQSTSCSNPANDPINTAKSFSGADLITKGTLSGSQSDYALLELRNYPQQFIDVTYLGWDRNPLTTATNAKFFNISHPNGDIKKVAVASDLPPSKNTIVWCGPTLNFPNWETTWSSGITGGGSSGSPLFNKDKRISGILKGGLSRCDDSPAFNHCLQSGAVSGPDWFGKFSHAWEVADLPFLALKSYLDPDNKNANFLNPYYPPDPSNYGGGGAVGGSSTPECERTSVSNQGIRLTFEDTETKQFGRNVASYESTIVVSSYNEKKVYVYDFNNCGASFVTVLEDNDASGHFGASIDSYGDYIIVGDVEGTEKGKVHVFKYTNGSWTRTQVINAISGYSSDGFGTNVKINGTRFVVGAPYDVNGAGRAYLLELMGSNWVYKYPLFPNSDDANPNTFGLELDIFGNDVVISTQAVSVHENDNVYSYNLTGSNPGQSIQKLTGGGKFANALALESNTLCVSWNSGRVRYYTKISGLWSYQNYIESGGDFREMNLKNDLLLVGHHASARLYKLSNTTWSLVQTYSPHDTGIGDLYGRSVSLSDRFALVGNPEPACTYSGSTYIYSLYPDYATDKTSTCSTITTTGYYYRGSKVTLGGSASCDYIVSNGAELLVESSDRIILKDGFKASFGSHTLLDASYCDLSIAPNSGLILNRTSSGMATAPSEYPTVSREFTEVSLYPNPSSSGVVTYNGPVVRNYQVYDLQGRLVKSLKDVCSQEFSIDVSDLETGIYVLNIVDEDNRPSTYKLHLVR